MKKVLLLSLLYIGLSCTAQENVLQIPQDTMREKLDIEQLERDMEQKKKEALKKNIKINYTSINLTYNFHDGSGYKIWGGGKNIKQYIKEETPPLPYFYTIHKMYNLKGDLIHKETLFGDRTLIGITQQYDEKGKLTEVNEDLKFGKIKPQDVLNILEEKGWVNQKTGEGRNVFESYYNTNSVNHFYVIEIFGAVDTQKIPDFGFPLGYESLFYIIDGETGEVQEQSHDEFYNTKENTEENSTSTIYKTHKGKTYTEEEWKSFEEQEYQNYLVKKNN